MTITITSSGTRSMGNSISRPTPKSPRSESSTTSQSRNQSPASTAAAAKPLTLDRPHVQSEARMPLSASPNVVPAGEVKQPDAADAENLRRAVPDEFGEYVEWIACETAKHVDTILDRGSKLGADVPRRPLAELLEIVERDVDAIATCLRLAGRADENYRLRPFETRPSHGATEYRIKSYITELVELAANIYIPHDPNSMAASQLAEIQLHLLCCTLEMDGWGLLKASGLMATSMFQAATECHLAATGQKEILDPRRVRYLEEGDPWHTNPEPAGPLTSKNLLSCIRAARFLSLAAEFDCVLRLPTYADNWSRNFKSRIPPVINVQELTQAELERFRRPGEKFELQWLPFLQDAVEMAIERADKGFGHIVPEAMNGVDLPMDGSSVPQQSPLVIHVSAQGNKHALAREVEQIALEAAEREASMRLNRNVPLRKFEELRDRIEHDAALIVACLNLDESGRDFVWGIRGLLEAPDAFFKTELGLRNLILEVAGTECIGRNRTTYSQLAEIQLDVLLCAEELISLGCLLVKPETLKHRMSNSMHKAMTAWHVAAIGQRAAFDAYGRPKQHEPAEPLPPASLLSCIRAARFLSLAETYSRYGRGQIYAENWSDSFKAAIPRQINVQDLTPAERVRFSTPGLKPELMWLPGLQEAVEQALKSSTGR